MDYEALLRRITASNQKTRAEFGKLSARVVAATLSGNEGELDGIIRDMAAGLEERLGELIPEQGEDNQLGGSAGDAEPTSERPGTAEESGSGI